MLRRLLVAIGAALVLSSAQGVTIADFIRSPLLGTGVTLARWISEGSEKVLYVEVIGEGSTSEQARQQGFRLAVEHAVGTVVSSETEVRNDRVARDEIITYASGYVDRFEVVEQQQVNNRVLVNMKVWVRSSKIANRLLNKSVASAAVEGGRISTQIQTLQQERKSGDRLLKSVLAGFPKQAFVIEMDKTQVLFDANRTGQLEVAFWLSWSKEYLESVAEALTAISHQSGCGDLFSKCRNYESQIDVVRPGFASTTQAWFNDNVAFEMVNAEMTQSQPVIRIAISDKFGKEQFTQCRSFPDNYVKRGKYRVFHNIVVINGAEVKRHNTFIDLSRLPTANLDHINITIVRGLVAGNGIVC